MNPEIKVKNATEDITIFSFSVPSNTRWASLIKSTPQRYKLSIHCNNDNSDSTISFNLAEAKVLFSAILEEINKVQVPNAETTSS